MSAKEAQIENEAKEIKASDQICEKLGINALNPIDFSNEEYFEDLKKCGKRDIKSIINSYNKFIAHHIDILGYLRESFTKIESDEKHEIENAKLIKSLKKNKKISKSDEDTNSEENDEESTKITAVKKLEKCHDFVKDFMVSQGYDESDEWSPVQIRSAMNAFVTNEREKNPDKINVKSDDGKINGKIFKVYGELKKIIENCIKNIKEDISVVEKSIKDKKKEKPEADSTAAKEITYMEMWVESKKELISTPDTLQFTDFMKYSPYCKIDRDPLEKARKKTPVKAKSSDDKKI